ncbi:hypothetical protein [Microbacterium sp. NIBRBAC000506063]|uniref:hypothetical protein n=1 Tax=Microbacterium sp. NIBRBAC000506063 TaxID=2734618 RepID=UPI001BB6578F|nr:hypothetical protein [Microbacterium sp. NIBRBAC000506063]QTV78941.1 hypothetical protein KAE78_06985 [Microbacterium sp. NIBRBAC000506063]
MTAEEQNSYFGVAGSAAGGVVGIGGSVVIATLRSNVTATVSSGVSITAGGNVTVRARTTEDSFGIAVAGAAGAVTISGQIVIIDSDAAQTAQIVSGAVIPHAGGTVGVDAFADREVGTLALGIGLGAAAVGVAIGISTITGDTRALIGNVTIGGASPSGGLRVSADARLRAPVQVYSVQGGILASVLGAGATSTISGRTEAEFAGTAILSGAAAIEARGRYTSDSRTIGIGTGLVSAGANVVSADISRITTALVTGAATLTAGGAISVAADTRAAASTNVINASGGFAAFSAASSIAEVSGRTTAIVLGRILGSGRSPSRPSRRTGRMPRRRSSASADSCRPAV